MYPRAETPSVSWSAELAALTEEAECPVCGRSCPIETPACLDGHGADCPERLCALCGTALIVHPSLALDFVSTQSAPRRAPARRAA